MSLRDRLNAVTRGEVSTALLAAYGTATSDAYDMLDSLPPEGMARLCAWCAFVLQTHADNLLASGSAPGYCDDQAYTEASLLYQMTGIWLDRARTAQTAKFSLDLRVPQSFPPPQGLQGGGEVSALRKTLETVQSRLGAELDSRQADPVYARLQPSLPTIQSALDTSAGLAGEKRANAELRATMAQTLRAALDRAFQAGQLLATPELIAKRDAAPRETAPSPVGPAALTMFLPGDPGFDPWCLTDPLVRIQKREDKYAPADLDRFWKSDPDPAKTLAMQAEIAGLLEGGAVDYAPIGSLAEFAEVVDACPWPGVLFAKVPVMPAGEQLSPGDRFVLAVGEQDGVFQRRVRSIRVGSS